MTKICMLTTIDNPYNPFTDFSKWFVYDVTNGYNSCGLLARVSHTSEDQADGEYNEAVEEAIDDIIECDFTHLYKKVTQDDASKLQTNESDKES